MSAATPTVEEVLTGLGRSIPFDRAAEWDVTGLQLGDPAAAVRSAAVCHEVTESVVERMESAPVDLLVTYHPLLFRPTTRLVAGRHPAGRAYRLVRAGVALAVAHTAFDAARGGMADSLAAALDLTEVSGFGAVEPVGQVKIVTFVPLAAAERVASVMAAEGAGAIGNYRRCSFQVVGTGTFEPGPGAVPVVGEVGVVNHEPEVRLEMLAPARLGGHIVERLIEAHPYEEPVVDVYDLHSSLGMVGRVGAPSAGTTIGDLAELVERRLQPIGLRVAGFFRRVVERVAVLPGSGGMFVEPAHTAGADVLVTGDVSHHQAVEAGDAGMAVIDPGHAATERPGIKVLAALVAELASVDQDLSDLDPTPWR